MKQLHLSPWAVLAAAALLMPASVRAQEPAQLVCRDGTSEPGPSRIACKQHGGVDWASTKAATEERAGAKQQTKKVVCIDGSNAARGPEACKGQGGIDSAATRAAARGRAHGRAAVGRPNEPTGANADTAGNAGNAGNAGVSDTAAAQPPQDTTGMQRSDST
ncbi:MAG TPA: hypothetical protein VFW66_15100 [Gemmatimonadales bacterium]|nr:hypothetical protein [Gemmatimonadales bacterium]